MKMTGLVVMMRRMMVVYPLADKGK